MSKILVPVDGSANSDKAVLYALTLANGKDDEIILLNVQPTDNSQNLYRFVSREEIRTVQEESGKEVLDHTLNIMKSDNVPVRTLVRFGDPSREICAEAEESSVDSIVMGHRGLGPIKRAFLGSVATKVLHEAPCPVTIVP